MDVQRRWFLGSLTLVLPLAVSGLSRFHREANLALWVARAGAAQPQSGGQETPPPKLPPEIDPANPPGPDPRAVFKANQKEIKRDARRLAELAEELKKEVEKTDSAEVLSLPLVRKAEEIEKLAKHIKALARG